MVILSNESLASLDSLAHPRRAQAEASRRFREREAQVPHPPRLQIRPPPTRSALRACRIPKPPSPSATPPKSRMPAMPRPIT